MKRQVIIEWTEWEELLGFRDKEIITVQALMLVIRYAGQLLQSRGQLESAVDPVKTENVKHFIESFNQMHDIQIGIDGWLRDGLAKLQIWKKPKLKEV